MSYTKSTKTSAVKVMRNVRIHSCAIRILEVVGHVWSQKHRQLEAGDTRNLAVFY